MEIKHIKNGFVRVGENPTEFNQEEVKKLTFAEFLTVYKGGSPEKYYLALTGIDVTKDKPFTEKKVYGKGKTGEGEA